MSERCEQFCPTIQKLKELMDSYKPEDSLGNFMPGSAAVQLKWAEQYSKVLSAAEQCSGPVVIDSVEVFKGFFRKRKGTVNQYACGLPREDNV